MTACRASGGVLLHQAVRKNPVLHRRPLAGACGAIDLDARVPIDLKMD